MVSPAPAPTASSATSGFPFARPFRSRGWTTRSFCPMSRASFIVQTTVPITLPSCILFSAGRDEFGFMRGVKLHCIHNADDGGIHGTVLAFSGHARGAAGDDKNGFAESGVYSV